MTYTLLIGEYAYSSWSMRGWLLLDAFGLAFRPRKVPMYSDAFTAMQQENFPARTVPTLRIEEDGTTHTLWDSLAIAETMAERHPHAGHWPEDTGGRMMARALAAEMHSGFGALRGRPSMNLRCRYDGFAPTDAERADADRVEALWSWALDRFGGPFLCGPCFGAVDAMYAPVATRFVTYNFEIGETARAYVDAIYATPSFRRWHACADAEERVIDRYHLDLPERDMAAAPRVPALPARPYVGPVTDAVNSACPYSGDPVAADSLAEIGGTIVGFCNPFCCRKTIADAECWPSLMALIEGERAEEA